MPTAAGAGIETAGVEPMSPDSDATPSHALASLVTTPPTEVTTVVPPSDAADAAADDAATPVAVSDVTALTAPAASQNQAAGVEEAIAATPPATGAGNLSEADVKAQLPAWRSRVLFSCNMVGWGLSSAVMATANKLRWAGGAQYNCAAYCEVISNYSYLARVEFVDPPAPPLISADEMAATRQQLANVLAEASMRGTERQGKAKSTSAGHASSAAAKAGVPHVPASMPAASDPPATAPFMPLHPLSDDMAPLLMLQLNQTVYLGSKTPFCPFAKLDDGLMDICAVAPASRKHLVKVMSVANEHGRHVLGGTNDATACADPAIRYTRAREVIVHPATAAQMAAWRHGDDVHDPRVMATRKAVKLAPAPMVGPASMNVDGELIGFTPAR
ncbi:hypothetical protein EON62_05480, partial [archaeon]